MEVSVKLNYIILAAVALCVSMLGRFYASAGMQWYYTLNLPSYTPPSWVFSIVWPVIFVLTATAAMLVWNRFEHDKQFWFVIVLFSLNAVLNVLWTYLFFYKHSIGLALIDAVFLFLTVLILLVTIGQRSLFIASLLAPYLGWMSFATFLNFAVWWMN